MIRILTDSAADLTCADAALPGVTVVPLQVNFANGDTALDGVDITGDEYYARLKTEDKLPRTSQPSPDQFIEIFEDARAAGDAIVAVLLSSTLSGTWQCARLAAETCEFEDLYLVDSRTGSQGEAILVREAVRLRDEEGRSAAEIAAALEELKGRIRILGVIDSLKHLHKGGRLPAAVALVGGALGIKPVLSVYDGAVHLADKARGRPGAYVAMFKQMDKMGGIDTRYDFVLVYSSDRLVLGPIQHYVQNNLKLTGGHISQIGSVIGTHIGPAAAGIAFVVPPQD